MWDLLGGWENYLKYSDLEGRISTSGSITYQVCKPKETKQLLGTVVFKNPNKSEK